MNALSGPNQVKKVKLLQRRVLCVCNIQEALGLAQPTTSKHPKIIEESGSVTCFKEGPWVNYCLSDGSKNPYEANLLSNLRHWPVDDVDVAMLLKRLTQIRRENICGA